MAESEAREIEQTGSKIIDDLLSTARESGMAVKITEEAGEDGFIFWTAEFRIPVWGRVGSSLRQQQEYDNLRVIWMRPPGPGRRPRMLDATRRELFRYKTIKRPKDMRSELRNMRREAEKATARLALRKGGESWRLETRGHRHETLTSRPVTLEEAEHLVAVASEMTAILAEEIRFYQWDTEAKALVRSALVPQGAADAPAWREHGDMVEDAGAVGGDIQIGAAPERRFVHASLPGRVIDVTAYPIKGDGSQAMPSEGAPVHLAWQAHMTICRDVTDPGGTEEWANVAYPLLPQEYRGPYATVEDAERAARGLITALTPSCVAWNGHRDFDFIGDRDAVEAPQAPACDQPG